MTDLDWTPVVFADDLPACIVWPGSEHAADATRWWVANDPETATHFYVDDVFGTSIEEKGVKA